MGQHAFKVYWRTWLRQYLSRYIGKMRGLAYSNARPQVLEALVTFVCSFAGVGLLAWLVERFVGGMEGVMLIPSFGASCLMVFGAPHSPFAQPRNVVGGHVLSALAGVLACHLCGEGNWMAAALAVSTAGAFMHLTSTMHPPGGATALLAVIGDPRVQAQGYVFALMPVGAGALLIVVMAVLINNLALHRQYPTHWR